MLTQTIRIEVKTEINEGKDTFFVLTENIGQSGEPVIATRVFKNGEPVLTRRTPCPLSANIQSAAALEPHLLKQHHEAIEAVKRGHVKGGRTQPDFLSEVRSHLRRKSMKKALEVLKDAHNLYPDDPYILSYYGCLMAIVEKKGKEGVLACRRAIETLGHSVPHGKEAHLPTFYLNLSRAYMAYGDKKAAVDALYMAAPYDPEGGLIHKELVKLGIRRKPAVPFLSRSNPINKYIGLLRSRTTKD